MLQALGVSPPVLHTSASTTIVEVPTGGLTARRSLGTGSRSSWVFFLLPPRLRGGREPAVGTVSTPDPDRALAAKMGKSVCQHVSPTIPFLGEALGSHHGRLTTFGNDNFPKADPPQACGQGGCPFGLAVDQPNALGLLGQGPEHTQQFSVVGVAG